MAVALNQSVDQRLIRGAGLTLDYNAAYTWMGWFMPTTLRTVGSAHNFLGLVNGTNNIDFFQFDIQATHHADWGQGIAGSYTSRNTAATFVVNTWYHMCLVRASATSLQGYVNGVADGAVVTPSVAGRTAADRMESGAWSSSYFDSYLGRIACMKAWTRALSAAEVLNEMRAIRPMHLLNLWGFWPIWSGQRLKDMSGNGRDWTEIGSGHADADNPPVSYGAPNWLIIPFVEAGGAGEQTLLPSAIASTLAFGTTKLSRTILANSIASSLALGTPKLNLRLLLTGLASGLVFGTPKLNFRILATAIASGLQFGTTQVLLDTDQTILPTGIASTDEFGTPKLNLEIAPSGLPSTFSAGIPKLNLRILVSAIASTLGFGTPGLVISGVISPPSLSSTLAFGITKLNLEIAAQGLASTNAFGIAVLNVLQSILPGSIASGASFGTPKLNYRILAVGIASSAATGTPNVTFPGAGVAIQPSGIASTLAFGTLNLVLVVTGVSPEECPADWNLDELPTLAFTRVATPQDDEVTPSTGIYEGLHDWS